MIYKCLIVDDEDLARDLIQNHLSKLENFELTASCSSAIEANNVLKKEQIDLMFLDIEMPVLKGTDFFKNLMIKPKVIFTTAYRDFALDGFELNAIDYLLKPITFSRFFNAIEKFLDRQGNIQEHVIPSEENIERHDFLFVRKDRKQVKVKFEDILYIEGVKDYIHIITCGEKHLIKESLKSFEKLLDNRFQRTHRSYIVNLNKVTAYTKQDLEIGKIEIPIGESHKSKIVDRLDFQ